MMKIRAFHENDYETVAAIIRAANSDSEGKATIPATAEGLRAAGQDRPAHIRAGRWVAEIDGQAAGGGEYEQNVFRYHPQVFWVDVYVLPERQRRGIGSALYDHVIEALAPLDPAVLLCNIREDMAASLDFLVKRGFVEEARRWEMLLDVSGFDPAPHAGVFDRLAQEGIALHTLPELATDPQRDQKLSELVWEYRQDMPDLEPARKEPFDSWRRHVLEDPDLIPEAFFVAVSGGEYVGASYYFGNQPVEYGRRLRLGQTGVARAFRGKGIALALRLRGAEYARLHGYTTIRTVNESRNEPMLRLNRRMGFQPLPAWVNMVKRIKTV